MHAGVARTKFDHYPIFPILAFPHLPLSHHILLHLALNYLAPLNAASSRAIMPGQFTSYTEETLCTPSK